MSSRSLLSICAHPLLGAQCPVASQWAAPSVIPAHGPDSLHKAPIVFTGCFGSHSVCHSATTCITRRHSGAFCFWLRLSCQQHRATLFLLLALFNFTLGGSPNSLAQRRLRLIGENNCRTVLLCI